MTDAFSRAIESFRSRPQFEAVLDGVRSNTPPGVSGLWGSSVSFFLSALVSEVSGPFLVVAPSVKKADILLDDLMTLAPSRVFYFPVVEAFEDEFGLEAMQTISDRFDAARALEGNDGKPVIVVTPVSAVLQGVAAAAAEGEFIRFVRGREYDLHTTIEWLADSGFERTAMVELPGEFAVRGGILDIYYSSNRNPVRLEFDGDSLESLREFDPFSQGSIEERPNVDVVSLAAARSAGGSRGRSLLDYLPPGGLLALFEEGEMGAEAVSGVFRQDFSLEEFLDAARKHAVLPITSVAAAETERYVNFAIRSTTRFEAAGERSSLADELAEILPDTEKPIIVCLSEGERNRIRKSLGDFAERSDVITGSLYSGFRFPEVSLTVLTTRELFNRFRGARVVRKFKHSKPIESFYELAEGDYVVHLNHGIGRFAGLTTMEDEDRGIVREFLLLEYADNARVYVPVTNIDLVQKYVGVKGFKPELSKLGSARWLKRKARVRERLVDLASDLLEIAALREQKRGIAYPQDDGLQLEFENSFEYEATSDQESATDAIKHDLENTRPMDRLLCGDVGYGKTELAVRAAFKVVCGGKQVAILVPTTVLAEQHGRTFADRLAGYPVEIRVLSRFRNSAEQKDIVRDVAAGSVDIVIGTHRLLSKDVSFSDLGLLIIDEEQRFGVEHKERLKRMRATVDLLTLTATPIPRTLNMALLGIKDISTLTVPPHDRLAVRTEVTRYDGELVRRAMLRELERGGQVFFVHNRVQDIARVADEISRLVPEVTIGVAHGQMDSRTLEARMLAFVRGEFDVLVSTTIIESGLDMPNVNTLFVNNAHMFGLADMHQLRGRIGRYKHRAYSYFLLPKKKLLDVRAMRRLKAIEEFAHLGAGFKIAMRDLEIRGAGNLLGSEQHGNIKDVGYDLYCRLLKNVVEELKNGKKPDDRAPETEEVEIDLRLNAAIDADYIADLRQRIEAYRKIASVRVPDDVARIETELVDRFGKLSANVRLLLDVALIRSFAAGFGIRRIYVDSGNLIVETSDFETTQNAFPSARGRARVLDSSRFVIYLRDEERTPDGMIRFLLGNLSRKNSCQGFSRNDRIKGSGK